MKPAPCPECGNIYIAMKVHLKREHGFRYTPESPNDPVRIRNAKGQFLKGNPWQFRVKTGS